MTRREPARLWRRSPRPWHGMTVRPWLGLLVRNRCAVTPGRLPMALAISALAPLHSAAAFVQSRRFGVRLEQGRADIAPVIIVGHWRTGTTLLHELLALDPQFCCPTTYECMAPAHFLVSGPFLAPRLQALLPSRRPLDDMRLRVGLPQEDEFALLSLGARSPYEAFAFPHRRCDWGRWLDPREFAAADRERWEEALRSFICAVAASRPGRVALKGPPHTARLGLLAQMFPGARFIHCVRHPYEMVPSLLAAWPRLAAAAGLQSPCRRDLPDFLLDFGPQLYRRFEEDRTGLDPGRITDVRFEDLTADPAAALGRVYRHLGLDHPEQLPERVAGYLAEVGDYRPATHRPSPEWRRRIAARWTEYATRYGYALDSPPGPS